MLKNDWIARPGSVRAVMGSVFAAAKDEVGGFHCPRRLSSFLYVRGGVALYR